MEKARLCWKSCQCLDSFNVAALEYTYQRLPTVDGARRLKSFITCRLHHLAHLQTSCAGAAVVNRISTAADWGLVRALLAQ
jgi:hypothetical protein